VDALLKNSFSEFALTMLTTLTMQNEVIKIYITIKRSSRQYQYPPSHNLIFQTILQLVSL
jgi:hypothetical protein